jgi:hypothetical protein
VAEQLRNRGQDVIAVAERPDLRSLHDPPLFDFAQSDGRALLTENVQDFLPIDGDFRTRGVEHFGLILTTNRSFPRPASRTTGMLVRALEDLLAHNASNTPSSLLVWLQPPT